ncbi:hypothetical protein B5G38_11460 [Gemmiger sp. An87]|nr:hypothetical protein B5G38_11460 [Gemmiger sp. An87]
MKRGIPGRKTAAFFPLYHNTLAPAAQKKEGMCALQQETGQFYGIIIKISINRDAPFTGGVRMK